MFNKKDIENKWDNLNMLEKVEYLAMQGLNRLQISKNIGVPQTTFYQWTNPEHKAFREEYLEAIQVGKAKGVRLATSKVFGLVNKGDLKAIEYYLERMDPKRWGRRTKVQTENTHKIKSGFADALKSAINEINDK